MANAQEIVDEFKAFYADHYTGYGNSLKEYERLTGLFPTDYDLELIARMDAFNHFMAATYRAIFIEFLQSTAASGYYDEVDPWLVYRMRSQFRGLKASAAILLYQVPQPGPPSLTELAREVRRVIRDVGNPLVPPGTSLVPAPPRLVPNKPQPGPPAAATRNAPLPDPFGPWMPSTIPTPSRLPDPFSQHISHSDTPGGPGDLGGPPGSTELRFALDFLGRGPQSVARTIIAAQDHADHGDEFASSTGGLLSKVGRQRGGPTGDLSSFAERTRVDMSGMAEKLRHVGGPGPGGLGDGPIEVTLKAPGNAPGGPPGGGARPNPTRTRSTDSGKQTTPRDNSGKSTGDFHTTEARAHPVGGSSADVIDEPRADAKQYRRVRQRGNDDQRRDGHGEGVRKWRGSATEAREDREGAA